MKEQIHLLVAYPRHNT